MSGQTRVVYWTNIPAPYAVERFNTLAERGNIDLEIWYSARIEPDRSWDVQPASWRFKHRFTRTAYLRLPRVSPHYYGLPFPMLRNKPDLLVMMYSDPSFVVGWQWARLRHVRTAFPVLPTYDSWIRRHPIKERLKQWMFPRVDGFEVAGPQGKESVMKYGVDPSRIHVVTQSVNTQRFLDGAAEYRPTRKILREQLHLDGTVFCYVGRIIPEKGVLYLLQAFRQVVQSRRRATLVIVGDGTAEDAMRRYVEEYRLSDSVRFVGFVQQPELPRVLAAADVLVFPTLGDPHGLVVEEAMASGLPIVTSAAAGDIHDRVREGRDGYVVAPADAAELFAAMARLADDPVRREAMGLEAKRHVIERSHERYAEDFEAFVEATLRSPRA